MKTLYLFLIFTLLFCSCINNRDLSYFSKMANNDTLINQVEYKIKLGDVLNITVATASTGSKEMYSETFDQVGGNQNNDAAIFLKGHIVDKNGQLELPLVGKITVQNLSLTEIEKLLKTEFEKSINFVTVRVKLTNFKISVLGEVKNPIIFTVYNPTINLLQAIATAGDLNDYSDRRNIQVIRTIDNKIVKMKINLVEFEKFNHQAFYLLPNDIIYVPPLKAKKLKVNTVAFQTAISIGTLLFLVLNFIKK